MQTPTHWALNVIRTGGVTMTPGPGQDDGAAIEEKIGCCRLLFRWLLKWLLISNQKQPKSD